MPDETNILFIHALTGVHPGSGTALGAVDLPVQRERHTQWPLIPGSSLKGVLRDACREKVRATNGGGRQEANADEQVVAVFGPARITGSDDAHAGAISLTDARILAFPVRSLRGVFAWVTCPAVLERLNRDLALVGGSPVEVPRPGAGRAVHGPEIGCKGGEGVVLEEFDFDPAPETERKKLQSLARWFARCVEDEATRKRLETHLAVLDDDAFTHFVRHGTEVVARIGLDYERKTVKRGALFYQEILPPETLFYSLVLAADARGKARMTAQQVIAFTRESLPRVLQIGGDETIGKGLCAVRMQKGGA